MWPGAGAAGPHAMAVHSTRNALKRLSQIRQTHGAVQVPLKDKLQRLGLLVV